MTPVGARLGWVPSGAKNGVCANWRQCQMAPCGADARWQWRQRGTGARWGQTMCETRLGLCMVPFGAKLGLAPFGRKFLVSAKWCQVLEPNGTKFCGAIWHQVWSCCQMVPHLCDHERLCCCCCSFTSVSVQEAAKATGWCSTAASGGEKAGSDTCSRMHHRMTNKYASLRALHR